MATHSSICLENPMDRGAWWATVHGVAKSWTRLKRLSKSTSKLSTSGNNLRRRKLSLPVYREETRAEGGSQLPKVTQLEGGQRALQPLIGCSLCLPCVRCGGIGDGGLAHPEGQCCPSWGPLDSTPHSESGRGPTAAGGE